MTDDCPICGRGCESLDHVRQHLHTSHRKSELIDELLDARRADGRLARA